MHIARFGSLSLAEWKPRAKGKRIKFAVYVVYSEEFTSLLVLLY